MSKLYRARSLLYRRKQASKFVRSFPEKKRDTGIRARRQILQVNIRWKALDEIYKITCFCIAQASIFQKFSSFFFAFFKNDFGKILQKFFIFEFFSVIFAQMLMKFYRSFTDILENVENNHLRIFYFSSERTIKSIPIFVCLA